VVLVLARDVLVDSREVSTVQRGDEEAARPSDSTGDT